MGFILSCETMTQKTKNTLLAVAILILGVAFIFFSDFVANSIMIILGIVIAAHGIFKLILSIKDKEFEHNYNSIFYFAMAILGLVMIVLNTQLIFLIFLAIGIYVTLCGLFHLGVAIKVLPKGNDKTLKIVLSIVELAVGLVFLFFPHDTESIICILMGIFLVYKAIEMLLRIYVFKDKKDSVHVFHDFYFHHNEDETYREPPRRKNPNIIDHDEITDDHIIKKDDNNNDK